MEEICGQNEEGILGCLSGNVDDEKDKKEKRKKRKRF